MQRQANRQLERRIEELTIEVEGLSAQIQNLERDAARDAQRLESEIGHWRDSVAVANAIELTLSAAVLGLLIKLLF